MLLERKLQVIWSPSNVRDAWFDKLPDVADRFYRLNLNAQQQGLVPPVGVGASGSRGGVVAQAEPVRTAPAPPPDGAVVREVDGILDSSFLHHLGDQRADDA